MSGFAKGADVSWLTEMEKDGVKFYNQNGKATECMKLLREEGTNSIRLRVWVNPEGGWCGKDDVTGGEVTVTADLNTMTWKYEYE